MSKNNINPNVPDTISDNTQTKFKGYSLEDLRYRRAVVALQKEFAKSKIISKTHRIQRHSPFHKDFAADKTPLGKAGALATKLISGLNFLDYAMIGFSVFNSGKKIMKLFRKKK